MSLARFSARRASRAQETGAWRKPPLSSGIQCGRARRPHCSSTQRQRELPRARGEKRPDSRVFCCSGNTREDALRVKEPDANGTRRRALKSVANRSGHTREVSASDARRRDEEASASDLSRCANENESRVHCSGRSATACDSARSAHEETSQEPAPGCKHSTGRPASAARRKKKTCGRTSYSPRRRSRRSDEVPDNVGTLSVLTQTETRLATQSLTLSNPPKLASELLELPTLTWKKSLKNLLDDEVERICFVMNETEAADIRT